MALDPQTLPTLTPAEFVTAVKRASDREIAELFGGPHREALLDAVFARFPGQFRPEKAGDRSARIDFRVTGGPDGSSDTYAVVVDSGACTVEKAPTAEPQLSLMAGPAEFLKLITGTGNPAMMFMMGKIKARGDIGLATALGTWFETPTA
ncbi:SCP2 sterol-binding domain-containing protein [Phycicoccus sp. CSK15P-2]|uniref:SCP2 sterol-binding domain-containing protein n=1 Tax=Phycicoccus sp. CSK15P-2 TaxID=2807627 RepID=UPI0019529B02|nr:SCP2 sterol-binding domain-containing protein [Phycicoccus sp. CSK15P-2]MBM6405527.1 SCP2 sterol-binding domain-containing protein [Phycicoccus sp. CSK15P-2]